MNDLISAAAFIRRLVPALNKMPSGRNTREQLLIMLAVHADRKTMCIVKDASGKLEAVGMATEKENKVLYVENVASRSKGGMTTLLKFVVWRWPNCTKIKFRRDKSNFKFKEYDMNKFLMKAGVI